MKGDDWVKIDYHFTMNYPANLGDEAETAKNLEGITLRRRSSDSIGC